MLKVLLLAALVILAVPAQANPVTVATNISPLSTAYSSQRKIVRDSTGNMFVVYLKPVGNFSQAYMSMSSDDGKTWSEVGRVSGGDFESVRVSIAINAADRIYVFWTKFIGEYGQIFLRAYDHGTWSDEDQITSGPAYSGFPSAAVDSMGRLHLVWYGFDGVAYQVYYSFFDGKNWTAPAKLSQGFPDSVNPTIAVDSKDNLHVAWYKSNGRQYQIYYTRWSGSWSQQIVLSLGLTDSFNPSLAIDPKDNLYVAWEKYEGEISQIYYAIYGGGTWTTQILLTSGGVGAQNPSVAVDTLGTVYVFYDKTDGQIYLRKYAGKWSEEVGLSSSGRNSFPSVRWSFNNNPFSDSGGKVDYVWTSENHGELSIMYNSLTITQETKQEVGISYDLVALAGLVGLTVSVAVVLLLHRRKAVKTQS